MAPNTSSITMTSTIFDAVKLAAFFKNVVPSNGNTCLAYLSEDNKPRHDWIQVHDVNAVCHYVRAALSKSPTTQCYFGLASYGNAVNQYNNITRSKTNAISAKALWLDIDAGEDKYAKHGDKVYRTIDDAIAALSAFVKGIKLPNPTYIVTSGSGLHVYWCLDREVEQADWERGARRLRAACQHFGLRDDPSRTTDVASILRVPYTTHKNGSTVGLIVVGAAKNGGVPQIVRASDMNAALKAIVPALPEVRVNENKPSDYPDTSFLNIATKSNQGMGCNQITQLLHARGNVEEPLWRAGLSIVNACTYSSDAVRRQAISAISCGHPDFNLEDAVQKAEATKGPYSCQAFESINCKGCEGCPFKNTGLVNPIKLGQAAHRTERELEYIKNPYAQLPQVSLSDYAKPAAPAAIQYVAEEVEPEVIEAPVVVDAPQVQAPSNVVEFPSRSPIEAPKHLVNLPREFHIPAKQILSNDEYPAWFLDPRPDQALVCTAFEHGNIEYRIGKWIKNTAYVADSALPKSVCVSTQGITRIQEKMNTITKELTSSYDYLINVTAYLTRRFREDSATADGQTENFVLHFGYTHDPMKSTTVSSGDLMGKPETVRRLLGGLGITAESNAKMEHFMSYLKVSVNRLREYERAELASTSIGWNNSNTAFALGKTVYAVGKTTEAPLTKNNQKFYDACDSTGTLEDWVRWLQQAYPNGMQNNLIYQFMILAGFGAPLHSLQADFGGIINLFNPKSGTGKTTAQLIAASIYGNPKVFNVAASTTPTARVHLMGQANSVPLVMDEITLNVKDQSLFQLVYASTHGRGKDKMSEGGQAVMDNHVSWRSHTMMSSNESLLDAIRSYKNNSEGMEKRVVEFFAPAQDINKSTIDSIMQNRLYYVYGVAGHIWVPYLVQHKEEIQKLMNEIKARFDKAADLKQADRFRSNIICSALAAGYVTKRLGLHPFDVAIIEQHMIEQMIETAIVAEQKTVTSRDVLAEFLAENQDKVVRLSKNGTAFGMDLPHTKLFVHVDERANKVFIAQRALREYAEGRGFSNASLETFFKSTGAISLVPKNMLDGTDRKRSVSYINAWEIDMRSEFWEKTMVGLTTAELGE